MQNFAVRALFARLRNLSRYHDPIQHAKSGGDEEGIALDFLEINIRPVGRIPFLWAS